MSPGSEVIVKWLRKFSQVRISMVDVCLSKLQCSYKWHTQHDHLAVRGYG